MKNWKDWALGIFIAISGFLSTTTYLAIEKKLDTILLKQTELQIQVVNNTKDIERMQYNFLNLQTKVDNTVDLFQKKFDTYDKNITQFYKDYGYLFRKPVSKIQMREVDTLWMDKKYYNKLNSMFDSHG